MSYQIPLSKKDVENLGKNDHIKKDTKDDMRFVFGTFRVEDYQEFIPTYKTIPIQLLKKHSTAIQHRYEVLHKPYHENVFAKEDEEVMELLRKEIRVTLDEHFKDQSVFVRLSTRSPKDSIVHLPQFEEFLKEELENCHPGNEVLAVLKAQHRLDPCRNENDVIDKLTNSKRVYEDFLMSNLFCDENNKNKDGEAILKNQQLLLRSFDETLNPELEIRCFVIYDEKEERLRLTAATQYFKIVYVDHFVQNKEKIEVNLRKGLRKVFDEKLEGKIKESFVIDIALTYEDEEEIKIIELNPYSKRTGSCFFDWTKDEKVLKGEEEFEFRIREEKLSVEEQRTSLIETIKQALDKIKPIEYSKPKKKEIEVNEKNEKESEKKEEDESNCVIL